MKNYLQQGQPTRYVYIEETNGAEVALDCVLLRTPAGDGDLWQIGYERDGKWIVMGVNPYSPKFVGFVQEWDIPKSIGETI